MPNQKQKELSKASIASQQSPELFSWLLLNSDTIPNGGADGIMAHNVTVTNGSQTKRQKVAPSPLTTDAPILHDLRLPLAAVTTDYSALAPESLFSAPLTPGSDFHRSAESESDNLSYEDLEKKKKRLEKNRLSARECRRRKREQAESMEIRCEKLEKENEELRLQLKEGKHVMDQEEEDKMRICITLEKMIRDGASEEEIAKTIDGFEAKYADYGNDRRSKLRYHLQQVDRLLTPTEVTKMYMWTLQQDDDFYKDTDDTSLSYILYKELNLSDDQKKQIIARRKQIRNIGDNIRRALQLVRQITEKIETKNETLESEMQKLQSILTPTQTAKFILWVTDNPACLHMLNQVWNLAGHEEQNKEDDLLLVKSE